MIARVVLALGLSLLFSWGMALVALAACAGNLTIAGNGPELTTIEPLARAFEKPTREPISMSAGTAIRDLLRWSNLARPTSM
jgi:hypothetical protein